MQKKDKSLKELIDSDFTSEQKNNRWCETKTNKKFVFNSIIKDENSTFYSTDKINRNITDKAGRSIYRKTEYLLSSMMNWKTKVTYV